jgi:hypothetical protein
VDAYRVAERR